ncbi:PIN domain nuclease of toxin-antitoxin system [Caulobacter ginsengisoli]|uniref:PIN domain nuclease of toxin-antitoxin system n=1 Tax=Caulobacter ginsengisoli TaxID=400775 RepID=A0ABU0ITJ2_9CAUL|nr:type II toxin-antitoxin system VapC family toxin [Caulobacter ginsengisoli]MDQ0465327.1 PIN domain nuclease of toxin-antitoxin system [Caulobacter ginsengisoli]
MTPILLDTCAAIWVAEGDPISDQAMAALAEAFSRGVPTLVSPFTAWEVGQLVSKGRLALTLQPLDWYERLVALPGLKAAPLAPAHLVQSSFLPGDPPRDPADRIMAATARQEGYRLMTRDRLLLAYGEAGHMQALAC